MDRQKFKRWVGIGIAVLGCLIVAAPVPYHFGLWSFAVGMVAVFGGVRLLGPGGLFGLRGQPPSASLKIPTAEIDRMVLCPEERRRALYGVALAILSFGLVVVMIGLGIPELLPFQYGKLVVFLVLCGGPVAGLFLVNPYLQCLWHETGRRRFWGRN